MTRPTVRPALAPSRAVHVPLGPSPLCCALLTLLTAPTLLAQESPRQDQRHDEPQHLDEVVVSATALPSTVEALVRPVDVLAGQRLDEAKAGTLGQTLSRVTGVQSSYFGPGVGRPIIRGLDGARVQVLNSGLGSGDVSTVSVDHAVSIEPFLANQIEVLKGPATLFYGSGAIGGAVNVIDGRIPEAHTLEPLEGRAELRAGSVNDERTGMLRLDGTSESGLVFHFDALHRESGDVRIPGHAERPGLHDDEHDDDHDHDHGSGDAAFGRLPNSAVCTSSAGLGVSWVGERGFIGIGHSFYTTRYGIPGHQHGEDGHDGHGHDDHGHYDHGDEDGHDHADDGVHVLLDQHRNELRAGLDRLGVFETLRLKIADTRYTHTEFEGHAVGTVFDNHNREARLELVHQPLGAWRGALGVQGQNRDFSAVGAEAFVPANRTRDIGLFYVADASLGAFSTELGARMDRNRIDTDAHAHAPDRRLQRDFDTHSLSAAVRWNASHAFHVSLGLDRAQRSPTAEELYSNGLHVATGTIELGNDRLGVETANRLELGAHWHNDLLSLGVSGYLTRYRDFIYLTTVEDLRNPGTVLHDGGLPVNVWAQGDARLHGIEADVELHLLDQPDRHLDLRVFGDLVRGRLDGSDAEQRQIAIFHGNHVHRRDIAVGGSGNLPRIAAPRLGAELRGDWGHWRANLGAVRYFRQDRVATGEAASDGYTLVNAGLTWHHDTATGNAVEVFVDGSNLLDAEARPHTSFTKDLAPMPGRGVNAGVRVFF
ncbi:MAG: TonB-dependent receptor [Pseudoxanthomonas suwonensis]|nr:TonB-dependent receptor [Pseudoxanthomonas suwonensis]